MTPDVNATSGSTPCWNCEQPLPIGSQRCLFCGVPQEARSAQFVLAPHGVLGAAPPPSALLSPGEAMPAAIGFMTPAMAAAMPPAPTSPLGAAFEGSPAGVGVRLAALTIDVIVIAVVSAAAALLLRSVTLTAIIAAELGAGLIVLQARTGLGIGGALLRIRVAKVDSPFSPGISRALLRALVGGAGGLLLVVGAWLIELTAAFDSSGRRRSWADLAAHTVVVTVPRRTAVSLRRVGPRATVPLSVPVPLPLPLPVPVVQSAPVAQPVLAAQPASVTPVAAPQPQEPQFIAPLPIVPLHSTSPAPAQLLTPQPITPQPIAPLPAPVKVPAPTRGLVPPTLRTVTPTFPHAETGSQSITSAGTPAEAPALLPVAQPSDTQPNPGSSAVSGGGELLLVFDTGQREQLPIPVSVNLGRNPAATDPGDVLIVVRDPESTVSKTHVRLEVARGGTWVTDTGSTNGTDLLDEDGTATQLAVGVRTSVEDGVRIRLGNRAFTIGRLMEDAQ
jgi:pSer/pThr/pTyr-binding forkhead associated (FHA) protein